MTQNTDSTKPEETARTESLLASLLDLHFIDFILPKFIKNKSSQQRRQFVLPLLIIILTAFIFAVLYFFAPSASKGQLKLYLPSVRVVEAKLDTVKIPVISQGIVSPKNEVRLVSVVSGPVTYVSPNLTNGGKVKKGELLVKVSDRSYQQDKAKAQANVAKAKSAQVAKRSELRIRGTVNTDAGKVQLQEVNTLVKAAEADVEKVNDLIENTRITATFDGIIRGANIYTGQNIGVGTTIGSVFTTESVILDIPLSDRQLALIDLPRSESFFDTEEKELTAANYPKTKVLAEFGDNKYTWEGFLVRSAGGRNEINRLQYVVVEIPFPYAKDDQQINRPPLSPGTFVQAEIEGREFANVIRLPRKALKSNQKVWGVDANNHLIKYDVELLSREKEFIYISSGIPDKNKVVVSDLEVLAEGIPVSVVLLNNNAQQSTDKTEPQIMQKKEIQSSHEKNVLPMKAQTSEEESDFE